MAITDVHNKRSQRLQPLESGSHNLVYLKPKEVAHFKLPNPFEKKYQRYHNGVSQTQIIPTLKGRSPLEQARSKRYLFQQ